MTVGISLIVLGLLFIAMGISNMMGNISSLHSYHRSRVAPEDVKPLGRFVGIGMVLCGVGCIAFGILDLISRATGNETLVLAGTIALLALIIAGSVVSILAIIKYNKGLF